jgi:hypothetical protein
MEEWSERSRIVVVGGGRDVGESGSLATVKPRMQRIFFWLSSSLEQQGSDSREKRISAANDVAATNTIGCRACARFGGVSK